jgi:hypothetical protein
MHVFYAQQKSFREEMAFKKHPTPPLSVYPIFLVHVSQNVFMLQDTQE